MTKRDEYLQAIYREHPRLRQLETGVEALVDWFLGDPDGFKKAMAKAERDARRQPPRPKEKDAGDYVITCVSKKPADEAETDPVADGAQPGEDGGEHEPLLGGPA
jgi:hypothetical protein